MPATPETRSTAPDESRWPGSASTTDGATDPAHYALINGVYLAGLSALAIATVRLERSGREPLRPVEIPLLGLAAFAFANVLAKEKVSTWLREPFVEESADHRPVRPEGDGLRYTIGELLTCTRCIGAWCALGLVGLRTISPPAARSATAVLATTGVNNFLQSAFRLLVEKTTKAEHEAEAGSSTA